MGCARALRLRFKQFSSHVARDLQGFCQGTALGDKARNVIGRRKIDAFRETLDV